MFNLRNELCQEDFKEKTFNTNRFSDCFKEHNESLDIQFKRWNRRLLKAIDTSFRKIRVRAQWRKGQH